MKTYTAVDLFCGCGGMSWGAMQAGFQILAGLDSDKHALATYQRNFGEQIRRLEDITIISPVQLADDLKLQPGTLDMLIGGPPCQGFSKNVPRKQRFFEDPRNQLVSRFLEFVEYLQPKVVVMENVAEMKNGFDGAYTNEMRERLERAGYAMDVQVLFAPDFGVPQRRRRAFFIANRLGESNFFPAPTHFLSQSDSLFSSDANFVTVREAIGDLPSLQHGEGTTPIDYGHSAQSAYQRLMRQNSVVLHDHVARGLQETQVKRLSALKAGQGAKDLPKELQPKSHFSGAYGRLEWTATAPTLTRWLFHPGSGRFGHPTDTRVITIREAARLQSFSDDFVFTGSYIQKSHQVGNAVPPLVMQAIATRVLSWLGAASDQEMPQRLHGLGSPQNERHLVAK